MTTSNANIGQAFPLENLASDIARNNYNYQSILNGLIEWNVTTDPTVTIRLTTNVDPYFVDYVIPSKVQVATNGSATVGNILGSTAANTFTTTYPTALINSVLYGGSFVNTPPWTANPLDLGDNITIKITNVVNGGVNWQVFYVPLITPWVSGNNYRYSPVGTGNFVSYSNVTYKVINNITNSTTTPLVDTTSFTPAVTTDYAPQPIPGFTSFNSSTIFQYRTQVDIAGFMVQNISTISSTTSTNININIASKPQESPSIYQRTVGIFPTCNFASWPGTNSSVEINTDPIWSNDTIYGPTDTTLDIRQRQNYSSVMVFNHADQTTCKTVNFININSPDLDQAVCIYLPCLVPVGMSLALPEDGHTFEFYFRIWPDISLTNSVIPDAIVNKAQVYVYSSPSMDSITNNSLIFQNLPIAKFSMSRLTNTYMFGENVVIPNKPVVYRATFIFSTIQNQWITLDYTQLDDHVWVGPIGFVDPQNPGNTDINSDIIGSINPSAKFVGYESCAFPTYTDVFSNNDLTPFSVNNSTSPEFFNRIINQ